MSEIPSIVGASFPSELISLIHHIELNKANWWDKSIQQLILGTVWLSKEPQAPENISGQVRMLFSTSPETAKIREAVQSLESSGQLIRLPTGRLKISEQALKKLDANLQEAESLRIRTKNDFARHFERYCPALDAESAWKLFESKFLVPLVREIGAKTYELVFGSPKSFDETPRLADFLSAYPPDQRSLVRNAITEFLDPKNPDVRSYFLLHLNAHFFIEAGNLSSNTLSVVQKLASESPTFFMFLDTNVVFSVLGLHANPADEAAQSLLGLVRDLADRVKCKVYVSPLTVDEVTRTLSSIRSGLRNLRLPPNLAEATLESGVSGVAARIVQEVKRSGRSIDPDDFLSPYIDNLIKFLRTKGVELFNEKLDPYRTRQDVIDDILQRMQYEQEKFHSSAKKYEEWEHDIVLWHFAKEKRSARVESPFDAKYWIVTIDYRFLGFDAFKRRTLPGAIPICLHPSAFIQMLQFWIPRTPAFEEAILNSVRLGFLFQEFDIEAEKITLRIIEAMARFENASDLDRPTIAAVLVNKALHQKMAGTKDLNKQVELVKEALIEEHQRTKGELAAERERAKNLESQIAEKTTKIVALETELRERKAEAVQPTDPQKIAALETELRERKAEATRLIESQKAIVQQISALTADVEARRHRTRYLWMWVALPTSMIVLFTLLAAKPVARLINWPSWQLATIAGGLLFIICAWLAESIGSRDTFVTEWAPFQLFRKFRAKLVAILLAIVCGALGNAVWEWIKSRN